MKILSILIIAFFLLASCTKEEIAITKKSYKTYSTETGNITVKDDMIVTVEGAKTSALAFRSPGIISDIGVLPGESVKKGQILARLANRESSIQIEALSKIESELSNLFDTTQSIKLGSTGLEGKTKNLYDERLRSLDIEIESMKTKVEKAKQNLDNQSAGIHASLVSFLNDFDRVATSMLDEGDLILGMTTIHESRADDWAGYLGAYAGSSREESKNIWNALYVQRGKMRTYTQKDAKIDDVTIVLRELTESYIQARKYAVSMNYMLQNSVIGGNLAENTLDGWKTLLKGLAADEQNSETSYITWKNSIQNITSTIASSGSVADKDITSLELELQNMRQSRLTLLAEKDAKIQEIQTNIQTIEGKKGEVGLKTAETKMNTALAKESIEYSYIRSPFDGVILEKHFEEGMMIGAGTPLLTISSSDRKMIKTHIDNTLYEYKISDTLILTDDDGNTLSGSVTLIQEQKDPLHNKNYLEIILSGEHTIGSKMTLHLERKKSTLQNGTLIPLSSIISRYGPPGVYIFDGSGAHFQLIEILRSDMSSAEVLGIPEGSTIITEGKENIYDGEML